MRRRAFLIVFSAINSNKIFLKKVTAMYGEQYDVFRLASTYQYSWVFPLAPQLNGLFPPNPKSNHLFGSFPAKNIG